MKTKATNFDKKFDDGESVIEHLDLSQNAPPCRRAKTDQYGNSCLDAYGAGS